MKVEPELNPELEPLFSPGFWPDLEPELEPPFALKLQPFLNGFDTEVDTFFANI